jgi:hypothetical protein
MTLRRSLKRRIRDRQEKTGESYTSARAQVLAARPRPSWVVELHDVTLEARHAGIVCEVRVTPILAATRSLADILAQLHTILTGSTDGLLAMQRVALRGEPDPWTRGGAVAAYVGRLRAFSESLEQGLRGPGPGGRILAFDAEIGGRLRTVLASLVPRWRRDPLLVLSVFRDEATMSDLDSFVLWARLPVLP